MAEKIAVCHLDEVPVEDMRCVSLTDRNVLVAHTRSGVFVADEMCTHEDARLCDGNLNGTLVKCPLHGSRFDLTTGEVLDDPADENLVIYPSTVEDGTVFITLTSDNSTGK
ncbi:MAG: non-heme iron oxygenase ferredoxin subunit [Pseudomonadota bacterium]